MSMADTTRLLILGTRTFAEEIADVASEVPGVQVAGFIENMDKSRCSLKIAGLPVFWIDKLAELAATHMVVCGLGTTHRDAYIKQASIYGIRFATIVHPLARISSRSSVGEGTIVSVGAIIAAATEVGHHVVINRAATIGHHTQVGPFTTIGPAASIAGNCRIGDHVYIGIGATVINQISVGSRSVIAAGAVVIENVPDRVMVAGVPARIVKENVDGK